MKSYIYFILFLMILISCNFYPKKNTTTKECAQVWLYMTFNLEENGRDDFYYYYGQVDSLLYEKINRNRISSGFIRLRNVRYWTTEDKLTTGKSQISQGTVTFRIEGLIKMELINGDPLSLYDAEEIEESVFADTPIPARAGKEVKTD